MVKVPLILTVKKSLLNEYYIGAACYADESHYVSYVLLTEGHICTCLHISVCLCFYCILLSPKV